MVENNKNEDVHRRTNEALIREEIERREGIEKREERKISRRQMYFHHGTGTRNAVIS